MNDMLTFQTFDFQNVLKRLQMILKQEFTFDQAENIVKAIANDLLKKQMLNETELNKLIKFLEDEVKNSSNCLTTYLLGRIYAGRFYDGELFPKIKKSTKEREQLAIVYLSKAITS